MDKNGLKNIGELLRIKLLITGAYKKSLKENPIGMDTVTSDIDDGSMIYETTIRGDFKTVELVQKWDRAVRY